MIRLEIVIGLPDYEISDIQVRGGMIRMRVRYTGAKTCPECGSNRLRNKGR